MTKIDEIRNIEATFNQGKNNEELKLSGYAIVYNSLSEPLYNSFREIIKQGAFTKSLLENDIVCLWGHDSRYVLGRKSAGTLILREDEKGLYFEVTLPNTTWARDLKESVNRKDIKQMSFGFKVLKDNWLQDKQTLEENKYPIREVEEISLHEISLVTFPAYTETNVRDDANYTEYMYIPHPPVKPIINDDFDYRSKEYEQKIKFLKINK